ncbi:MAG: hypothetical protein ACM3ZV_14245 [Bacillota bacterium]
MSKYLIALAIASVVSVPAAAQSPQTAPATNQAQQQAKPQTIKKRVCEENDNPYSRIMRVCHVVEVPAPASSSASNQAAPANDPQTNSGN